MELHDCINFLLTNAQNAVFLYFKRELQEFNVTPIQYALLKCLWDEDDQMPSQLAQVLCLDSSTVTGIMGRLEDKGLIIRAFCKTDRRRVSVHLTQEGKALQAPIEQRIAQANIRVTEGLRDDELLSLKSYLRQIGQNANALSEPEQ
jgi:DNA-binding MarR family transcriptional regulator